MSTGVSGLSAAKRHILAALDIPRWQLRSNQGNVAPPAVDSPAIASMPGEQPASTESGIAQMGWSALRQRISTCRSCDLHQHRTQPVFGVGDESADWLIVGEAPGQEEDHRGEPFVGRAGKLLDNMLAAIGLAREQVYIANIVKCRPPNNRDPHVTERDACHDYLLRQIALLQPKIIIAVGRVAAHSLLATDEAVGKLRRREFSFGEVKIPLVVTYHPAYLLRSPIEKRKVWEDLCFARERYNDRLTEG